MPETMYSVHYYEKGDDVYTYSADWDYSENPKQWSRSSKGGLGTSWEFVKDLDNNAHQAILAHLWLENYADEFPLEKIITMSPAKLVAARREKEKVHKLDRKEIVSNTLGGQYPAESFD